VGGSIRFHPYIRLSSDQKPGPTNAKAAAMAAMKMCVERDPRSQGIVQSSRAATSVPATGVHKPARSSSARPMAAKHTAITWRDGPLFSFSAARQIKAIPATRRKSRTPTPGQPLANVENRRRK
jgi:hypothetical protein